MSKTMLKCPNCETELQLKITFSGADWETVAGDRSGYGHPISLVCNNDKCASIYPLVHVKNPHDVSVVKEEHRSFVNYNL